MIKNALDEFAGDVFQYLTGKPKTCQSYLVKKHSENIHLHGDYSFPNTLKSWHVHVDKDLSQKEDSSLMAYVGKEVTDIISESQKWALEVAKVKEEKGRIHLYLNRLKCIRIGLLESVMRNVELSEQMHRSKDRVSYDTLSDDDNLTSLRLKCLTKSIEHLYSIHLSRSRGRDPAVVVTAKSSFKTEDGSVILCGAVLNAKTGAKETTMKANDYIRKRQDEMTLIAQHKYGVRVSTDSKWKEFISHLGESAVVFELLQTKPSSAVKIDFDCSSNGSSKGASFILYNCARLEAIIRGFSDKVAEGVYPPLPPFEDTDFSLLTQEDEWCLVFNYIMGFPTLLNSCVEVNERICEFRPHQLCGFLCSMVRVVSQYYRKTRILTEPRKHLLPVLFARLHMLKILNETLKTCLNILNIKSVSQMYLYFYLLPVEMVQNLNEVHLKLQVTFILKYLFISEMYSNMNNNCYFVQLTSNDKQN